MKNRNIHDCRQISRVDSETDIEIWMRTFFIAEMSVMSNLTFPDNTYRVSSRPTFCAECETNLQISIETFFQNDVLIAKSLNSNFIHIRKRKSGSRTEFLR